MGGGGGGGGGLKRGGADCRRSRPGEGAGGGHPSRLARGYGGALEAPPWGSGPASAFCVGTPSKTTQKLQDADCDVPNREKCSKRDSDCLYILNLAFLDGPAMLDETHARALN